MRISSAAGEQAKKSRESPAGADLFPFLLLLFPVRTLDPGGHLSNLLADECG